MRIVLLSDFESTGGAAIAASRLAENFCASGHEVTRIVARAEGEGHPWKTLAISGVWTGSISGRMVSRLCPPPLQRRWFSRRAVSSLNKILASLNPEVINVHNLHQAAQVGWSHDFLRACLHHAPTVWTLHDAWSFTAACSYPYECRRFTAACNRDCPHPAGQFFKNYPEEIHRAWAVRQHLFQDCKSLAAITPSQWLAQEAEAGLWQGHRLKVIANGINLKTFSPMNREQARSNLGIETSNPVLLVAAHILADPRKGGTILQDAFTQIRQPFTLLTVGKGSLTHLPEEIRIIPLGYLNNSEKIATAYNAADLLLHPTLADNLPNTVAESLACGTPVAAFRVGGLGEMVEPGKTGWLADTLTATAFAEVIAKALADFDSGADLRAACRAEAEEHYDLNRQAGSYLDFFKSLQKE